MIIKKGTTVYPSIKGEYNFHYPQIEDPYVLLMDIEVDRLHWAERDNKIPVKISSPEDYLPYSVLWLETPV